MSTRFVRAGLFQAEEWLEYVAQSVFGDPGPVVLDNNFDILI